MENKKVQNFKLRNRNQEIAPEPTLKAPPPTPCIILKQRSGSVPDVRILDIKREKMFSTSSYHRSLFHTGSHSYKASTKSIFDSDGKRSSSEHAMVNVNTRTGPWMVFCLGPCTSNLLHSVRQRLMNLS